MRRSPELGKFRHTIEYNCSVKHSSIVCSEGCPFHCYPEARAPLCEIIELDANSAPISTWHLIIAKSKVFTKTFTIWHTFQTISKTIQFSFVLMNPDSVLLFQFLCPDNIQLFFLSLKLTFCIEKKIKYRFEYKFERQYFNTTILLYAKNDRLAAWFLIDIRTFAAR